MLTELHFAARQFDQVYYVTRELTNDNSNQIIEDNVTVVQMNKADRRYAISTLPMALCRKEVRNDIKRALHDKYNFGKILRYCGQEMYCAQALYHRAKKLLKKFDQDTKITLLATWFSEIAYVAARLKKANPMWQAVSLAHAYEINLEINPYVYYSLNEFKHRHLDEVAFISYEKKKYYYAHMPKQIDGYQQKSTVEYLGCSKIFHRNSNNSQDEGNLEICSCSGINRIKRLDLLVKALALWKGEKIHWVHIGTGEQEKHIRELASELLHAKENITVDFLGKLPNSEVQKYYSEHPVDLFVNVSESEGIPVSIMEAMAYGIPALATDVGGTREIVSNQTGYLVPKDITAEELCTKLEKFQRLSQGQRMELAHNAEEVWKKSFDAEKNIKNFFSRLAGQ